MRDRYFNPMEALPGEVRRVLGTVEPGPSETLTGERTWTLSSGETLGVNLQETPVQDLRVGEGSTTRPFLTEGDAVRGTVHTRSNGSRVYHLGFPLGLSWMYSMDPELSGGRLNTTFDTEAMAVFYGDMLDEAGVKTRLSTSPTVVAHVSDSGKVLLVRDRNPATASRPVTVAGEDLGAHVYAGAVTTSTRHDGARRGEVRCTLDVNSARILCAFGQIELASDGAVTVDATGLEDKDSGATGRVVVEGATAAVLTIGKQAVRHEAGTVTRFSLVRTNGIWTLAG